MSFRPIATVELDKAVPPKRGSQPGGVIWVKPSELGVDTRYQRDLGAFGERRVQEIALNFDWRKFTPIVVARRHPADGEGYLVIDGQHRAAAALARGDIEAIPAWAIDADLAGQAHTFLTINAYSARVNSGTIWYALAASGDEGAKALLDLCAETKIEIVKYPCRAASLRFDRTSSPNAIDETRRRMGIAPTRWALTVLREAGERSRRCLLTRRLIRAAASLRKYNPDWANARGEIAAALAQIKVEELEARATIAARDKGGSRQEHFLALVRAHIVKRLDREAA